MFVNVVIKKVDVSKKEEIKVEINGIIIVGKVDKKN